MDLGRNQPTRQSTRQFAGSLNSICIIILSYCMFIHKFQSNHNFRESLPFLPKRHPKKPPNPQQRTESPALHQLQRLPTGHSKQAMALVVPTWSVHLSWVKKLGGPWTRFSLLEMGWFSFGFSWLVGWILKCLKCPPSRFCVFVGEYTALRNKAMQSGKGAPFNKN